MAKTYHDLHPGYAKRYREQSKTSPPELEAMIEKHPTAWLIITGKLKP